MIKLASIACSVALGAAGLAHSVTAQAHPYVAVDIGLPRVVVTEPYAYGPGYYGPYAYGYHRYWHADFDRYRYEHAHRYWEHYGDRHWGR